MFMIKLTHVLLQTCDGYGKLKFCLLSRTIIYGLWSCLPFEFLPTPLLDLQSKLRNVAMTWKRQLILSHYPFNLSNIVMEYIIILTQNKLDVLETCWNIGFIVLDFHFARVFLQVKAGWKGYCMFSLSIHLVLSRGNNSASHHSENHSLFKCVANVRLKLTR